MNAPLPVVRTFHGETVHLATRHGPGLAADAACPGAAAGATIRRMTHMLQALTIAAAVVLLAHVPAAAQERESIDVSSLGPQVGEKIPDFALPDQYGKVRTLDSIMGERGAMIVFHRSANW